ncbi:MAG: hypothetical protein IJZ85_03270 [Lachnospiraceae bacterium]|nr:hypothetical protein [Lachnospiraceae bacterium]
MEKKKEINLLLVFGLVIALVAVVFLTVSLLRKNDSAKETLTEAEAEKKVEELFVKTIHDFPNRMIDNLDENENTNFIVYAEDVKRITSEGGANVISSVDDEEKVYIIDHPDDQVNSLKKGDVFFMEPSIYYGPGISVKVKQIRFENGQAIISGDDLYIEDLIEYADVDMVLPITQVYYDSSQMPEGAELSFVSSDEAFADTIGQSGSVSTDSSAHIQLLSASPIGDLNPEFRTQGKFSLLENTLIDKTLSALSLTIPANYNQAAVNISGHTTGRLYNIHVVFKVYPLFLTTCFSTTANFSTYSTYDWNLEYTGSIPFPVPPIIVPISGPVVFQFAYNPSFDFGISLTGTGTCSSVADLQAGYTSIASTVTIPSGHLYTPSTPSIDLSLTGVEGNAILNVVSAYMSIGIPKIAALYAQSYGGPQISAKLENTDWTDESDDDFRHECERCADGDLDFLLKLDVGISLDFAGMADELKAEKDKDNAANKKPTTGISDSDEEKESLPSSYVDSTSWSVGDLSWNLVNVPLAFPEPYDNFYVSFRGRDGIEFDWGKCPYILYRTDVSVINEDRFSVPNAFVTVKTPDGESEEREADEDGELRLYLPKGDTLLKGSSPGKKGEAHAKIEDEPIEVELILKNTGDLFVLYPNQESDSIIDSRDTNSWSDVYIELLALLPEATFLYESNVDELCATKEVAAGNIVLVVTFDAPHTSYGEWTDDDLSDGNQSNIWGESGGWIFIEGRRIYEDDYGFLNHHQYFSLSISYNGAYKAYLANPKPVSKNSFEIRGAFDISPQYDNRYKLIGRGMEDGSNTWFEHRKYVSVPYSTDVSSIRSIPSQRSLIPSYLDELLVYVQAMIDELDLTQEMPIMSY